MENKKESVASIIRQINIPTPHPLSYFPPPSNIDFGNKLFTIGWSFGFSSPPSVSAGVFTAGVFFGVSIDGSPFNRFVNPSVPAIFNTSATIVNTMRVPFGEVVDILLYNYDVLIHPFHIHGYQFYKTGSGYGTFDTTPDSDDIKSLNLINPMRGDLFTLNGGIPCMPGDPYPCVTNDAVSAPCPNTPSCLITSPLVGAKQVSWTTFRVHFNNRGPWLSHCHVTDHIRLGLEMLFIVGDKPYDVPSWVPRSTFNIIKQ